jgi:hypothetical protein
MLKIKLIVYDLCHKIKKILFSMILCFGIVSILANPRTTYKTTIPNKISSVSDEEELVNLTLDHNQCLSYGHTDRTFDYHNCMEKLQKQRHSIAKI